MGRCRRAPRTAGHCLVLMPLRSPVHQLRPKRFPSRLGFASRSNRRVSVAGRCCFRIREGGKRRRCSCCRRRRRRFVSSGTVNGWTCRGIREGGKHHSRCSRRSSSRRHRRSVSSSGAVAASRGYSCSWGREGGKVLRSSRSRRLRRSNSSGTVADRRRCGGWESGKSRRSHRSSPSCCRRR